MKLHGVQVSAYETFQLVAVLFLAAMFALSTAARRYPHVTWLRSFANVFPRLTEEQRQKARRRANLHAGAELILLGIALPFGYATLTLMTFSSFTPIATGVVAMASLLCIGFGITAIRQNRR